MKKKQTESLSLEEGEECGCELETHRYFTLFTQVAGTTSNKEHTVIIDQDTYSTQIRYALSVHTYQETGLVRKRHKLTRKLKESFIGGESSSN